MLRTRHGRAATHKSKYKVGPGSHARRIVARGRKEGHAPSAVVAVVSQTPCMHHSCTCMHLLERWSHSSLIRDVMFDLLAGRQAGCSQGTHLISNLQSNGPCNLHPLPVFSLCTACRRHRVRRGSIFLRDATAPCAVLPAICPRICMGSGNPKAAPVCRSEGYHGCSTHCGRSIPKLRVPGFSCCQSCRV